MKIFLILSFFDASSKMTFEICKQRISNFGQVQIFCNNALKYFPIMMSRKRNIFQNDFCYFIFDILQMGCFMILIRDDQPGLFRDKNWFVQDPVSVIPILGCSILVRVQVDVDGKNI